MRREDQQAIVAETHRRVVGATVAAAASGARPLDEVLAEAVFQARTRHKEMPASRRRRSESAYWDSIERRLGRADEAELRSLLGGLVARYIREVVGHFDERLYALARSIVPPALGLLLNAASPKRLMAQGPQLAPIEEAIILQGETEHVRRLHELGTIIIAPTHVSNLDSIILAVALQRLDLPPVVYGAARDLFAHPLLRFFLHNLGAYTVDRINLDPLYKEVLKVYATLTLEFGYDNLFFPSGRRSRSGAIERRVKLGLVGTAIPAYVANLQRAAPRPKLFIVPATLSYQLVLEAETLIDDFLKDVGKSRYIITDDEFSRPRRLLEFVTQAFALDSKIYLTLSRGIDPFGNPVDDAGESRDARARKIDLRRLVTVRGAPVLDGKRDRKYTQAVGDALLDAYHRDNVLQATHITARAIFNILRKDHPGLDLLRFIRVGGRQDSLSLRAVYTETGRLMDILRGLEDERRLRLAPSVRSADIEDVVTDGLRHFAIYHSMPAAERRGDRVRPRNRALLFYYQNRLEGYDIDQDAGLPATLTDDGRLGRTTA